MRLRSFLFAGLFSLASVFSAHAGQKVVFAGSTTCLPFIEKMAPIFKKHGMDIEVQAGGSSVGFKTAKSGLADFGMMSRELKKSEKPHVKKIVFARDWLVMLANKAAPFDNITTQEVIDLYTGKIKSLHGYKLNVIAKESGRGTKAIFDHFFHLGKKAGRPIAKDLIIIGPNGQSISTVAGDPHGIAYLSYSAVEAAIKQGEPVKMLTLDGIAGTPENVISGKYKLQRTLNLVYSPEKEELANRVREVLKTDEARKILKEGGVEPVL